jgi:hypothetical protein
MGEKSLRLTWPSLTGGATPEAPGGEGHHPSSLWLAKAIRIYHQKATWQRQTSWPTVDLDLIQPTGVRWQRYCHRIGQGFPILTKALVERRPEPAEGQARSVAESRIEDSVEKCRAVGQAFTMKHRSPELVRVVPTMVSICKLEGPQQVGDSHRRGVFQQSHRNQAPQLASLTLVSIRPSAEFILSMSKGSRATQPPFAPTLGKPCFMLTYYLTRRKF